MLDELTHSSAGLAEVGDHRFELPAVDAGVVLLVDDDPDARVLNRALLERAGYSVHATNSPSESLLHIREGVPVVLVTDFEMPEMSGLDLAERALEIDPDVRVILLTGSGDEGVAQAALRLGASDYIRKPPDPVTLARSVQRAFHQRAAEEHHRNMVAWMRLELDRRARAIEEVSLSTLSALASALDMRSPYFHGHSRAVAMQAAAIAETIGLAPDEVEVVRVGGLLHDVGMMAIPDRLLEKTSPLTDEELALIRTHCERGVEILQPMKHLGEAIRYVHEHHERLDGSGYPAGKEGAEISLGGQIVGIAEAWVALLQSRAHRSGMSREASIALLTERQGRWFSAEVTDALKASDVGVI